MANTKVFMPGYTRKLRKLLKNDDKANVDLAFQLMIGNGVPNTKSFHNMLGQKFTQECLLTELLGKSNSCSKSNERQENRIFLLIAENSLSKRDHPSA